MSTVPWVGRSKRALPWDPDDHRAPRPRHDPTPPPLPLLDTASSLFLGECSAARRRRGDGTEWRALEARDSVERLHDFPGTVLRIRELSDYTLNGTTILYESSAFAKWLVQNKSILDGRRVLELKSGTGALAIFLRKALGVDITTSDFCDKEIEHNLAYNCRSNSLDVLPHIQHTWGDPFPVSRPDWDILIASDIELYADQSPNLVKTISFLLREYRQKGQKDDCISITNKSEHRCLPNFPSA
ncbi:hypothetical protein ACP4OV_007869 [Aristida adscensionis]